jgi:hypothetical protein
LLASNRFGGRNGVIRPWVNGVDGERTHAGRILEVLDRHTGRYELVTRQDLTARLATGIVMPERLNQRRRLGDVLRDAGLDPAELQRRSNSPTALGDFIYSSLAARGDSRVTGIRPNTINLGSTVRGTRTETSAGEALGLVQRHLMQSFDQQARAYTQRDLGPDNDLRDPSLRPIPRITTRFSGYNHGDPAGCFRRGSETVASSGMARTTNTAANDHYMAHGASNMLGAIVAEGRHLTAGRRAIDAMLESGWPVQIAVMRRGDPGAAAGNPGSGLHASRQREYGTVAARLTVVAGSPGRGRAAPLGSTARVRWSGYRREGLARPIVEH